MEDGSPIQRIAHLEQVVERLAAEVAALRRELAQARPPAGQARPASPLFSAPGRAPAGADQAAGDRRGEEAGRRGTDFRIHSHWTAEGVEKAAGRYGMLALATITGLAAVGTFISWAAARVEIGPEVRVGIGVLLAIGLAVAGIRLLPRERSFGGVLLGLALAVTHVCAWGAGPAVLGIVPGAVALPLALLASAALAVFAHHEDDEPLWCAGFGGAAIAPFVTTDEGGSAVLLMLYGAAVMLAGCWALRRREWNMAGRVLVAVGTLFTIGLLAAGESRNGPELSLALSMGVATLGVLPFAGEHMRRSRLRAFGLLATVSALAALDIRDPQLAAPSDTPMLAMTGAAMLLWLWLVDRTAALPAGSLLDGLVESDGTIWDWADTVFIPLAFLAALVALRHGPVFDEALPAAVLAAAAGVFATRRTAGGLRDGAVFTLCASALLATWNVGSAAGEWQLTLLLVPAVAFVAANRGLRATPWLPMAFVTLLATTLGALGDLSARAAYAYTPFLTMPSFAAMAVVGAWAASSRLCLERAKEFRLAAFVVAFLVVHQELYEAVSPTVSTLLIISYYAATAVALVGAGRRYANASLRHLGLLMALVAAGAAARGAAKLEVVWAQIAGYLVASAFLLGLAWWYRRRAGELSTDTTAGTATTVAGSGT